MQRDLGDKPVLAVLGLDGRTPQGLGASRQVV
jgi:hypothetical protein